MSTKNSTKMSTKKSAKKVGKKVDKNVDKKVDMVAEKVEGNHGTYWAPYNSDSMSFFFSVCSIVAHLKLCLCFVTKLCGCGAGEEQCREHAVMKAFLCIIGFGGSAICLFLTAAVFIKEIN